VQVKRELGYVALSDIGEVFDDAGNLVRIKQLPRSVRACIASVKTLKTNVISGDGRQETTREVKLWHKVRALEILAKHFGLLVDRVEVGVSEELLAKLDAFKVRNRLRGESEGAKGFLPSESVSKGGGHA
jgi:hypothetical protein